MAALGYYVASEGISVRPFAGYLLAAVSLLILVRGFAASPGAQRFFANGGRRPLVFTKALLVVFMFSLAGWMIADGEAPRATWYAGVAGVTAVGAILLVWAVGARRNERS